MCKRRGEQTGLVTLSFDLLTLKVVSESRVMWDTPVPILTSVGLSVVDFGPDIRDRQTSDVSRQPDRQTLDSIIA